MTWIVLAFVGLLAFAPAARAEVPDDIAALREQSLALVNEARRAEGLSALSLAGPLVEAAQTHASDMLERDYYSHVSPEGETVMDRYLAAGGSRNRLVEENIAKCTNCSVPADAAAVQDLHEGWMNSPEHRENILAEGIATYGFGIAETSAGTRYAVETFAGPGTPRSDGGATSGPIPPAEQTERALSLVNDLRGEAGAEPLEAAPALVEAAGAMIPDEASDVSLDNLADLETALPAGARWRSYRMLAGACGGCGTEPTAADVRFFVDQWRDDPRYSEILTDPTLGAFGMAIEADGEGGKIAVGIPPAAERFRRQSTPR